MATMRYQAEDFSIQYDGIYTVLQNAVHTFLVHINMHICTLQYSAINSTAVSVHVQLTGVAGTAATVPPAPPLVIRSSSVLRVRFSLQCHTQWSDSTSIHLCVVAYKCYTLLAVTLAYKNMCRLPVHINDIDSDGGTHVFIHCKPAYFSRWDTRCINCWFLVSCRIPLI